jgi:hypothetical protein
LDISQRILSATKRSLVKIKRVHQHLGLSPITGPGFVP